jgi:hypothetical protein
MGYIDTKHERFATLPQLVPVGNNIADEIVSVHTIGELIDYIVAPSCIYALQVRVSGRVVYDPDQMLLFDQLWNLRTFNDLIEIVAQAATV